MWANTTLITLVLGLIEIYALLYHMFFPSNLLFFLDIRKILRLSISADAFDTDRLLECMGELKSGQSVNIPIYDFKNHRRCSESFRKVILAAIHLMSK
jgi:hypothetical protein